jgi:preprotein translocase subunit SecG
MLIVLSILFILICLLLVFMVVITPSQEGGMAAAFGGIGSESFFGTKAHQHINKFTIFLAVSFLVLAVVINKINAGRSAGGKTGTVEKLKELPPDTPEMPPPPPK